MNMPLEQFPDLCKTGVYCAECRRKDVSTHLRAFWRTKYIGVPDDDVSCLEGRPWIDGNVIDTLSNENIQSPQVAEANAAICRQCEKVKRDEEGNPIVRIEKAGKNGQFFITSVKCGSGKCTTCGGSVSLRDSCPEGWWGGKSPEKE